MFFIVNRPILEKGLIWWRKKYVGYMDFEWSKYLQIFYWRFFLSKSDVLAIWILSVYYPKGLLIS